MTEWVENRRKTMKMTQKEVSDIINVDQKTYRRKIAEGTLTTTELIKLSIAMDFEVMIIPKESVMNRFGKVK